jgi:hypothetical protein
VHQFQDESLQEPDGGQMGKVRAMHV